MSALDQEADIPGSSTCVCKNPAEIDRRRLDRDQGTIFRYVFLHSIVLACLVGVLVTLQAYVYPFTEMVLK